MPFAPAIAIELSTPAPKAVPAITARVTQKSGESALKDVEVVFPTGFQYNEQFGPPRCNAPQEKDEACPEGSKLGTVSGVSALASAGGDVYVTTDLRLISFVEALGGIVKFKVVGTITIDESGGFAVTFSGTPNLALTSLELKLKGDALGLVKNPATCGDFRFTARFESYDGDTTTGNPIVPITGCQPARIALSRLRVSPSLPKPGKPITLRWKATAATEKTKVVLRRAGRKVFTRTVTGTSLRFASLRSGRYVARLTPSGGGRTATSKRVAFRVAR